MRKDRDCGPQTLRLFTSGYGRNRKRRHIHFPFENKSGWAG
jgi:hypothetical protein